MSWQGWLVTIAGLAIIGIAPIAFGAMAGAVAMPAVFGVLVLLAVLLGTTPGGPSDADGSEGPQRVLSSELPNDNPSLSGIIERLEHRDH